MGYSLAVGPMLDDEGVPVDEQDVLGYSEHALRLPMDALQAVSLALQEEQLPELAKVASPGCIAGPRMPKSCSPGVLGACQGSALMFAPMQSIAGGYREPPPKAAAAQVAFAARQLRESSTLGAVAVVVPQAQPGKSHFDRWWPVVGEGDDWEKLIVGHIELSIAVEPWGAIVMSKDGRKDGQAVWVRVPQNTVPPPVIAPRPTEPEVLTEWLLTASRWVMVVDTAQLPQDSRARYAADTAALRASSRPAVPR